MSTLHPLPWGEDRQPQQPHDSVTFENLSPINQKKICVQSYCGQKSISSKLRETLENLLHEVQRAEE